MTVDLTGFLRSSLTSPDVPPGITSWDALPSAERSAALSKDGFMIWHEGPRTVLYSDQRFLASGSFSVQWVFAPKRAAAFGSRC